VTGAPAVEIAGWLPAVFSAAEELATTALGYDGASLISAVAGMPCEAEGALVPLTSDRHSLQCGLFCSLDTCRSIVASMLGMDDGDELDDADVADALGEVANILGGGIKARMVASDSALTLGLPVVIKGSIEPLHTQAQAIAEVLLGDHRVWLVALTTSATA